MKTALARFALFGLLALTSCVRAAEGVVREQAASAFSCADYALHVEEIGPDVFRASGCGQELIYACRPSAPQAREQAEPSTASEPRTAEVADIGDESVMVCARRPR